LLLEKLSPTERAAYILREAFDYSYDQIAHILRSTEANARQLVARARKHISDGRRRAVDSREQQRLLKAFIVVVTSVVFALGHYANMGFPGVEQAIFTGLVFGTIFAITGQIWMVMCAHAAFDLTAIAIIYWNIEAEVAHLFFK
jgi:hypothetical protein